MKPLITRIILLILLMGFATPINHRGTESTETILIVDLTKKLPDNPYQTEYEKMLYPTVRIVAGNSTGSGVIFATKELKNRETEEHYYILTAAHVVGDNSTVTVEIFTTKNTKDTEIPAIVVMTDTTKDLALLKPRISTDKVYSATLAPKDYTPYIFAPVYTIGCSLGLVPRPSIGIISYIGDDLRESASHWEISSPILPGNSGGPVYALVPSDDGNGSTYAVIGIAVWIHTYNNQLITTMAGVVPITEIHKFLQSAGVIFERHGATEGSRQGADTPPADYNINHGCTRMGGASAPSSVSL